MTISRRTLFQGAFAGAATPSLPSPARAQEECPTGSATERRKWRRGVEGQRKADLGDGSYLNPIVPGDHPDPTILKDGKDYYMTFSSFESYPGITIWHSRDLVTWMPVVSALQKYIGSVWALDLVKYAGRYFVYIPAIAEGRGFKIYAIWADKIEGPWSDPVDLGIDDCIDPGHVVGEDGKRYLFVNGIRKVPLTNDGLKAAGPVEHAYSPWRYPEDWVVEAFAPEGPKLLRHGDYFYLVTAVGGTAGPPTGHMIIAARSRSVHGPWEHCPHNPIIKTYSPAEPWWSRGHGTPVEGPSGDWWIVYHAYENGYRTLGRQTILEPIEWTADGWFRAKGGDLSVPLDKPKGGAAVLSGIALSDNFTGGRLGLQWSFHAPDPSQLQRARYGPAGLWIEGAGTTPADSPPLTCTPGDRAYEAEVSIKLDGQAEGGLLLFYSPKAYVGVGFDGAHVKTFAQAEEQPWMRRQISARTLRLKVTNDHQIVTFRYSTDGGESWQLVDLRMEVSGINHNVFGGFLSLKPAIYAAGKGRIQLRDFNYRAL